MIQDADKLLLAQVKLAVSALQAVTDADSAAIRLAETYAEAIDNAETARDRAYVVRWIGPLLLDCLIQLGATPMARGVKAAQPDSGVSRLDELRAARR